jgi:hypothetical protein
VSSLTQLEDRFLKQLAVPSLSLLGAYESSDKFVRTYSALSARSGAAGSGSSSDPYGRFQSIPSDDERSTMTATVEGVVLETTESLHNSTTETLDPATGDSFLIDSQPPLESQFNGGSTLESYGNNSSTKRQRIDKQDAKKRWLTLFNEVVSYADTLAVVGSSPESKVCDSRPRLASLMNLLEQFSLLPPFSEAPGELSALYPRLKEVVEHMQAARRLVSKILDASHHLFMWNRELRTDRMHQRVLLPYEIAALITAIEAKHSSYPVAVLTDTLYSQNEQRKESNDRKPFTAPFVLYTRRDWSLAAIEALKVEYKSSPVDFDEYDTFSVLLVDVDRWHSDVNYLFTTASSTKSMSSKHPTGRSTSRSKGSDIAAAYSNHVKPLGSDELMKLVQIALTLPLVLLDRVILVRLLDLYRRLIEARDEVSEFLHACTLSRKNSTSTTAGICIGAPDDEEEAVGSYRRFDLAATRARLEWFQSNIEVVVPGAAEMSSVVDAGEAYRQEVLALAQSTVSAGQKAHMSTHSNA